MTQPLKKPDKVPQHLWDEMIRQMNLDLEAAVNVDSSHLNTLDEFDLTFGDDSSYAIDKVLKAALWKDEGYKCLKCGSPRIISGEDWSECIDCGQKSFIQDPPTYYDNPNGYEAECSIRV